jgi:HTH-type transcriptional regulator, transcriptional repressor of NAD biosynthesis genes
MVSVQPATGLIIGRFDPPHLGHSAMIDWAAARVERLVVFVNTKAGEWAPGELRASWLASLHPGVDVREVAHSLPTNMDDPELWERWMDLLWSHWPHDDGPEVVVSSDFYTGELARRFGAEPLLFDPDRATVPISATMIRIDPAAHLSMVAAPVAAWIRAHHL